MSDDKKIQLYGRVFIYGYVKAVTGLHIGASETAVSIGGVENTVIRDLMTGRPYIPGSSLKGKMRSLTEKHKGLLLNQSIGRDVRIHICKNDPDNPDDPPYEDCPVCHIYGVPANNFSKPTRLIVRDIPLSEQSVKELKDANTDQPFTEVKTEVAVDRITAAANPRPLERVPAGAQFGEFELVFSLFDAKDAQRFMQLLEGLQYVQDDYLGGSGTRGSGKVAFVNLRVELKNKDQYHITKEIATAKDLKGLTAQSKTIQAEIEGILPQASK
ncbi:MAG: type III-A CRISPR-associated RAMP protein Csm3 [Anaerolineae bacterium]|nr:type III-A CRISPR-associated RAMP protein Csm3 [Anaerolineae bacterium]